MNEATTIIESLKSVPAEVFPWVVITLLILLFIGLIVGGSRFAKGKGLKDIFKGATVTNEQLMLQLKTIANNHLHDLPEVVDALRRQEILLTSANEKLTAIDKGVAVLNTKIDALK